MQSLPIRSSEPVAGSRCIAVCYSGVMTEHLVCDWPDQGGPSEEGSETWGPRGIPQVWTPTVNPRNSQANLNKFVTLGGGNIVICSQRMRFIRVKHLRPRGSVRKSKEQRNSFRCSGGSVSSGELLWDQAWDNTMEIGLERQERNRLWRVL